MSSSPRFWQKLGLGKQAKSLSDSTSTSDLASIHSTQSFQYNADMLNGGKRAKRFSALRHKSSSISLFQHPEERRNSFSTSLKSIENQVEPTDNFNHMSQRASKSEKTSYRSSTLKKLDGAKPSKLPSIKKTKSNQSFNSDSADKSSPWGEPSAPTTKTRLVRPTHYSSSAEEEEIKSTITRSSSNGSSSAKGLHQRRKSGGSIAAKKVREEPSDFSKIKEESSELNRLKEELELEKSATRALQGQKEAIAKDLDYFCSMVDELTEEKEEYKRKFEEQVVQNESLKKSIQELKSGDILENNQALIELNKGLENVQQQMIQEQYVYYNNLQLKNDEIGKLKNELKQAQNQIQILRTTMKQLLKEEQDDEEELLLGEDTVVSPITENSAEEDLFSALSNSDANPKLHRGRAQSAQYDFLKSDLNHEEYPHQQLVKRRSEEFSKKTTRRRKDQLEEILGEVNSQLSRVQQKIRPIS